MPNDLYKQLHGARPVNPMIGRISQFMKTFSGNPQTIIQNMINSGKISQSQVNEYAEQANEIYKQMKGIM